MVYVILIDLRVNHTNLLVLALKFKSRAQLNTSCGKRLGPFNCNISKILFLRYYAGFRTNWRIISEASDGKLLLLIQ